MKNEFSVLVFYPAPVNQVQGWDKNKEMILDKPCTRSGLPELLGEQLANQLIQTEVKFNEVVEEDVHTLEVSKNKVGKALLLHNLLADFGNENELSAEEDIALILLMDKLWKEITNA